MKKFRKRFSINAFKDLSYPLAKMTLNKDWIKSGHRGDPYPLIKKEGNILESVENGKYSLKLAESEEKGSISRMVCGLFPYASYELKWESKNGKSKVGFSFITNGENETCINEGNPELYVSIEGFTKENKNLTIYISKYVNNEEAYNFSDHINLDNRTPLSFIFFLRPGAIDLYLRYEDHIEIVNSYQNEFYSIDNEDIFLNNTANVYVDLDKDDIVSISKAEAFLDAGISQADIRPLRFEDGSPIIENGRMFFSFSARLHAGALQEILSWDVSSCDFKLEGAIFYCLNDKKWCSDVAASIIFDRNKGKYLIWYCSFSHGHYLAHGESFADLKHGINVIDATLMPKEEIKNAPSSFVDKELGIVGHKFEKAMITDDTLFFGKYGDEDPDFVYDKEENLWHMIICRVAKVNNENKYRYFHYVSSDPFKGYTHVSHSEIGENTGGSLIKIDNEWHIICGSDFNNRAVYYDFLASDMSKYTKLTFDHDDGGFRGWGTVFKRYRGSREIYTMITFDRQNGSSYNWSYGNLHVFDAI